MHQMQYVKLIEINLDIVWVHYNSLDINHLYIRIYIIYNLYRIQLDLAKLENY